MLTKVDEMSTSARQVLAREMRHRDGIVISRGEPLQKQLVHVVVALCLEGKYQRYTRRYRPHQANKRLQLTMLLFSVSRTINFESLIFLFLWIYQKYPYQHQIKSVGKKRGNLLTNELKISIIFSILLNSKNTLT